MSKYLSSQQVEAMRPEIIAYNKYHMQKIDEINDRIIELQEYHDATVKHEFQKVGDALRYERSEIFLILPKSSKIKIRVDFGHMTKNKWEFYLSSEITDKFKNVSHKERAEAESKFPKPKNVGKLSVKKVEEWVEYWSKVFEVLEEINGANMTVVEKFRDKIKDLPVKWYHGSEERGFIDGKNGLRYMFSIEKNHVAERIEYVGAAGAQTIDTFLEVSGELIK